MLEGLVRGSRLDPDPMHGDQSIMKRILIASIAALSVAATPALAVTTSAPAAKAAAKQDKAHMKAAKASQKAPAKSAKLAVKSTKKTS